MKKNIVIIVIILAVTLFVMFLVTNNSSAPSKENPDFEIIQELEEELLPTSFHKIEDDFNKEMITRDQMYAYKLVSMYDSSQLHEKYQSDVKIRLEGDTILMVIQENFENLKPETQELLAPLLLPFTNGDSFFHLDNQDLQVSIINDLAKL